MNGFVISLNTAGRTFVSLAAPLLVQSSALIVAVLVLDLFLRRRIKAVVRYWIWLLVLAKLVLPPTLAAPTSLAYWIGAKLPELPRQIETVIPEQTALPPAVPMAERSIAMAEPRFVPPVEQPATQQPVKQAEFTSAPPSLSEAAASEAIALAPPPPSVTWQAVAFLVWLFVVVVMAVLLIQRAFFVRGLVVQSTEAPGPLVETLDQCRRRMGVSTAIGLRLTSLSTSPSVCGLWKPRILMPRDMVTRLDAQQFKSIVLHELAHVKRGDLWVNLVQALLQIAYFFHPLLWLANLIIRRVREQAVDETVLAAMGDEAEDYPRTLLNISRLAFGRPTLSLRLIGVVESKKALTARIKHIVSRPFPKSAKLGLAGLVLIATVAAVLLPMAKAEKVETLPKFTDAEIAAGLTDFNIDPDAGKMLRVPYWRDGLDLDSASTVSMQTNWPTGVDINIEAELRNGRRIEDFVAVRLGEGEIDDVAGRRILTLKSDTVGTAAAELNERFDEFRGSNAVMNGFYTNDLPTFFAVLSDGIVTPTARLTAREDLPAPGPQLWLIHLKKARSQDVEIEYWPGQLPEDPAATAASHPTADSATGGITGQLVDPNGTPVSGAQVALCTEDKAVTILTPRLLPTDYATKTSEIVETDAEGRFSFPNVPEDFVIVASHESGFAEIDGTDFTSSTPIRLEAWGQIEGTLYVGREPARDEALMLDLGMRKWYAAYVHYEHRAETKPGGRFDFRQVRPGWLTIGRCISLGDGRRSTTDQRPIYVKPGETLEVTLGREGRPVVGTFALPPDDNRPADVEWISALESVRPQVPEPVGFDKLTGAEKGQWYRQWGKTPEGRAYFEAAYHDPNRRRYSFKANDNNTFRIDNVIAGRYQFTASFREDRTRSQPFPKFVGPYFATIDVPPMAEAYTNEPLDLGTVTLTKNSLPEASSLARADEIAGAVVDPNGNPIMDAQVNVGNMAMLLLPESRQRPDRGRPVIQQPWTRTDEEGRFRFTELRPGKTDITVSAPGLATRTLHDVSPGTLPLRVQLGGPRPCTVSGTVVDEAGAPIAGAEVILSEAPVTPRRDWAGTSMVTATNGSGQFHFSEALEPITDHSKRRDLFVSKAGYGIGGKDLSGAGGETSVRVILRPEETVSGRVIDADGRPVPDALVKMYSWWPRDDFPGLRLYDWSSFAPQTQTGPTGQFTLTGLPTDSTVYLRATAPGYAAPEIQGVQTGEFGTYGIRQSRGDIINIGPDKSTATPMEFVLQRAVTLRGTVVYEDSNQPAPDLRVSIQGKLNGAWSQAWTDEEGRFEMTDVAPLPCNLMVLESDPRRDTMPDWTAQAISLDDLQPGETRENLQLVLTKGGIVRGRIVDAEGHPLQGIGIGLHSAARPRSSGAIQSVRTGQDGTWTYRLPPGEVHAYISMGRDDWTWQPKDRNISLRAGQTVSGVDFQLGQVMPQNSPHRAQPIPARSDFAQDDSAAGPSAARTIHGVVTDTLGRPRECVHVAAQGTRVWDGVMSDAQGRFTLENVTPEQTTWIAYSQASRLYGFFTLSQGMSAQPIRATLNLDEADLSGRVVDAEGKAVAEREVEVIVTTSDGIRFPLAYRPKTDAYGYYAHSSVPCGAGISLEARVLLDGGSSYSTKPVKVGKSGSFVEMPLLVAAEKQTQPDFDRNVRDDGMLHCQGRVVDEAGQPIEGVRIEILFDMSGWMSTWVRDAVTDAEGRWHRAIPPQAMGLTVEFDHPEYYLENDRQTPSIDELKEGTHVIAMKRGLGLQGRVVNELGQPVENVLVCANRSYASTPSPYNQIIEDSTTARTRRDGTFRIGGLAPGQRTIAAYSHAYAPTLQTVDIQTGMPATTMTLAQGKTYRGRVVDCQGQPIEGVRIGVQTWRLGKEQRRMSHLAQTDAEGNFAMTNLPEGEIGLYFGKKPLMGFRKDVPEDLSETDVSIMYEVPVFTGKVIDAETDEPITEFEIANGIKWKREDASFDWSRYHRSDTKDANGTFTHRWGGYGISYPLASVASIKVQAPGYLPTIALPVEFGAECEPLTIRLRRGAPIKGTVRTPDGSPAAEAQIALVRAGEQAYIDRYQFSADSLAYQVELVKHTDDKGTFELPPSAEQGLLVAVHESGYARVPSEEFANGSDLTLRAWSRVEGTIDRARIEDEDSMIALYPLDVSNNRSVPGITWLLNPVSPTGDAFAYDYLPAVPLVVGRMTRYEMNDAFYLIPEPGQTVSVAIGAHGRPVTGQLFFPPEILKDKGISLADPRQTHAVVFKIEETAALPAVVSSMAESSFRWFWRDKEHVYAPSKTVRKRFVPRIDDDGRFTFPGLEPGEYEFVVNIHAPLGENVSCGRGVLEGVAVTQFTVPEGGGKVALRVPDIRVQRLSHPGTGEPAPLFEAETFDGQTVRLADLRGKVVLLDFWASWCSPCVAELPKMQALYDAFADEKDLAVIGLSLDWEVERAKRLIDEKQLDWTQVCLGSMDESIVVKQYGVGEIPMTVLIAADGTILARGADAAELKPMIEKALATGR